MLRITGGKFRGRKIKSPPKLISRPTLDRVREALFNILGNDLTGIRFFDLYAGVGLVGIEALSRGADEVVFVEKDAGLARILRENLRLIGEERKGKIYRGSAGRVIARLLETPADVIFLDPPYAGGEAGLLLAKLGDAGISPKTKVVVQHHGKTKLPPTVGNLRKMREERYGDTLLSFFLPS